MYLKIKKNINKLPPIFIPQWIKFNQIRIDNPQQPLQIPPLTSTTLTSIANFTTVASTTTNFTQPPLPQLPISPQLPQQRPISPRLPYPRSSALSHLPPRINKKTFTTNQTQ
jgi:hypothetical protein